MNTCFPRDLRSLPAVIATSLLVLAAQSSGQTDRVDAFVREQMQTWHIPGVSIGVVRDGKVILAKATVSRIVGARRKRDGGHSVRDPLHHKGNSRQRPILLLVEEARSAR